MYFKVTGILFSASEELTFSTYQQFFKETGVEKTRFIIYGPSRVNRIVKYLAVFSVGPKLRNGPYKGFGIFFNTFFLELVLKLAMISKTQVQKWFIENKFKSVSPGLKYT